LTAILIASMPLFVALLAVRLSPGDKPTGLRLLGLVIGLGGVVALLGSMSPVAGRSCSVPPSCSWRRWATPRRPSS